MTDHGKRVIVCGGRDFLDQEGAWRWLDSFHASGDGPIAVLIHGAARGADTIADAWAAFHGVRCMKFPANWKRDGKAAGPIRNQRMIDEAKPDAVIAFPGGRGTADMRRRAVSQGLQLFEVQTTGLRRQA